MIASAAGFALLAQDAAPSPLGGMLSLVTMFLPLALLWFLLLERPRQKQLALRKQMLQAIKKNDRVLTTGGIYGVVTNVQLDSNEITIRVDETSNAKLRVTLGSIERILGDETSEKQEPTK